MNSPELVMPDLVGDAQGIRNSVGQGVTLPRRSTGALLRIATLSRVEEAGIDAPYPTEDALQALRAASRHAAFGGEDFWLCSGYTLSRLPDAEEVLEASGQVSVIFEVWDSKTSGFVSWFCAFRGKTKARCVLLRRGQFIFRRRDLHDEPRSVQKLARVLELGAGTIRFDGLNLTLVLLICGENNAVTALRETASKSDTPALRQIVSAPWAVLNPSHHAYWPQSKMTGFAKVGRVGNAGPTLAHHVQSGQGSASFILHCNNYLRRDLNPDAERRTRQYASVVFTEATGRTPLAPTASSPTNCQNSPAWYAVRYQVALPSGALVGNARST
ncbi:hypothetical protein HPC49_13590 [Pyxidicoccus fallax]|uniref:Uncharacterized protein n=1 Tax=Pyxidicoccus fallax TaxID=394095 RepID=A0A848L8J7_9BACT|nr:hypothetical protein [Pyxidicoccus fallax]NMO14572.1 hypothetical protein [Pyxidicoccus fallax]NPC79267.1 hypothetical protein [Pyxidicoccus fallax]